MVTTDCVGSRSCRYNYRSAASDEVELLKRHDVIAIGAGAAGLMCAATAGQRGRRVLVVDHAARIGEKIRISGGGRCNFTNQHCTPANFLSANPHFCISALRAYTPQDFIALVDSHGIAWHEKTLGQLFCDDSAQQIIDLLVTECRAASVEFLLSTSINGVERRADGAFALSTTGGALTADSLVVATGGLSIPKIGATGYAYELARQFGVGIVQPRPGLVPLTFTAETLDWLAGLSGISVDVDVETAGNRYAEALLFTHRGLSGPAILQASSHWASGAELHIDLAPGHDVTAHLLGAKRDSSRQQPGNALAAHLPRRLAQRFAATLPANSERLADVADAHLRALGSRINRWTVVPAGTEGFRKAEVTVGGVDTAGLNSRDLQARAVPGLFFVGEALDVTGHLGGHNFQWAWSSGYAAGRVA